MTEPIPLLEPLVSDLKNLHIGDFLQSNDYKRYLIKVKFEVSWRNALDKVKANRRIIVAGFDHDYFDSIDTMVFVLNYLYTNSRDNFYHYIHDFLMAYSEWNKEDLKVENIIEDLELLEPPQEVIAKIELLGNFHSKPVSRPHIPDNICNASKLDTVIKKMDASIQDHDYNLTLTYAYSSLEGLFKAYANEHFPEQIETDKLNSLAKLVRENIASRLESKEANYPEQVLNLITTMTNAISKARNSFSDSHFDGESDKWLAEFARDCVNSIGRLIIKFIK